MATENITSARSSVVYQVPEFTGSKYNHKDIVNTAVTGAPTQKTQVDLNNFLTLVNQWQDLKAKGSPIPDSLKDQVNSAGYLVKAEMSLDDKSGALPISVPTEISALLQQIPDPSNYYPSHTLPMLVS